MSIDMDQLGLAGVLGIPVLAVFLLAFIKPPRLAAKINVLASLGTFLMALSLFFVAPPTNDIFALDALNIYLLALNNFIGLMTSLFSVSYIEFELKIGRMTLRRTRFYHSLFQVMLGAMNLAFVSNDLGLVWVGVEIATLATILMVGVYRTPAAIEAAWKYFILGSVGISLAFFGTILIYFAAQGVLGEGLPALAWTNLRASAAKFDPALLGLSFAFFMAGYGTKIALAPLHAWLPDAHAEGPTPITAVLSGLLLNVAMYAVLRVKMILSANPDAVHPGVVMVVMGLSSLIFAGFMLYRQKDIKRFFGYSSIEHMGIVAFAFGMGGAVANLAGLLHMTMHALTKAGIFFSVGQITQIKGSQRFADIRGLSISNPVLAWGLAIGVLAIAGLPPFGVFMSEFLIVTSTFAQSPWLGGVLVMGLLLAFGAMLMRLQDVLFGEPTQTPYQARPSYVPFFTHFFLVLVAGVALPVPILHWLEQTAALLK